MDESRARSRPQADEAAASIAALVANVARVVHAEEETLRRVAYCLVGEGHLIVEDFPELAARLGA